MISMKKALALILVLAMLSGLVITVSAAGEDFTLSASASSVNVGDTVTITLNSAKTLTLNAAEIHVWFKSAAFSYVSGSIPNTFRMYFGMRSINQPVSYEGISADEQALLDSGYESVWITLNNMTEDSEVDAGEWASMVFTATAPVEAGQFIIKIPKALHTVDGNSETDMSLSGGSVSVNVAAPSVAVTGITLDQISLSLTAGGETATLIATVEPDNATDKNVTWTSSDPAVATVSDGVVTPVAQGTATITASAGDVSAECAVTVITSSVAVTGVSLDKTTLSLIAGGATETLIATIAPEDAAGEPIAWTSSDSAVATVSGGIVTPVAAGTATITASAGGFTAECAVTVAPVVNVTKVAFGQTTKAIRVGETFKLTATVTPTNATYPELTWESSNTAVATVDQNGNVTAVSAGGNQTATAKITATTSNGKKATCTVTVYADVEGSYIVVMPADTTVDVGTTVNIPVTINGTEETYNAFDVTLSYDAAYLTLLTETNDEFTVVPGSGTVRVYRYGNNATVGQTAFTLQFKAIAAGESIVSCTKAFVDKSENATTENVASATIEDAETVINANALYTVTLAEGLSSQQDLTVEPGSDFTFQVDGYSEYYVYDITATMGGETVALTDNGAGSYTISNITGNVEVSFTKTGIQSNVTIIGEDTTGDPTATYGTDYTFNIAREDGYTYNVTVTIGGEEYTGFTGPDAEGNVTIPGTAFTGPVAITVTKTETVETYSVTFDGAGAAGAATATKGTDYTFTVAEEEDFAWQVEVTIGGAAYTEFSVSDNTYTIPGADITGDIVITTTVGNKIYHVSFIQTNGYPASASFIRGDIRSSEDAITDTVERGSDYVFSLQMKSYYAYEMTVTMAGLEVPYSIDKQFDWSESNPIRTFTIQNITGDVEIRLTRYMNLDVKICEYVQLDGKTVYLVVASEINGGRTIYYMNTALLKTDHYKNLLNTGNNAYSWLIVANDSFNQEEFIKNLKMSSINQWTGSGRPPAITTINVNGDVNSSNLIDINDAQLVYDIYMGNYESFDIVTMQKFLQADINKDGVVDTRDAAGVIPMIA